ncbi:polysaccharide biosynthesis protein [Gordonia iterans]
MTAGSLVANLLAYVVQVPASRILGPAGYGEFAVLLAAMLVMAVPALALQSVVARELVRGSDRRRLWRLIAVVTVIVAVASVGAAFAMMAIADTGAGPAFAAMAGAAPLAVIAGGQGFIQGDGRFGLLGGVLAGVGVLRSVPVIVAVLLGGGPAAALAAGTVGTAAAALAVGVVASGGWSRVGRSGVPDQARGAAPDSAGRGRVSATSVLWASGVQLVIIVAVSIDLLLSRTVLSAADAGVYALGAVATKAAFWLPQAVGVVVYPRLADPLRSTAALRSASRVLAGIGAAVTAAAAAAGPLVPVVVSADYRPIAGLLWLFALTGAMLAVLQLLLLAAIARDRSRGGLPASVVLLIEVVLILTLADSVLSLAVIAAVCAAVSVVVTYRWIALTGGAPQDS